MNRIPRILPLVAVAIVGVLAVNAMSGARSLPDLLSNARVFAEEAAGKVAPKSEKVEKGAGEKELADASKATSGAPVIPGGPVIGAAAIAAAPVCAPSAAELAKEAGLSPAELQMLQSLGARRGQLDKRETDLDVQLKLIAAAEAKLDAKLTALTGLKTDINALLGQADAQSQADVLKLVKMYEGMAPKKAAPIMEIMDDDVRLPVAAKMKERSLSTILGLMKPQEARELTEKMAKRFAAADVIKQGQAAVAPPAAAKPTAQAAAPAAKPKPA